MNYELPIFFIKNYHFNFNFIYIWKIYNKKIHWDWPAVSEAIRSRPGHIHVIYYKLDKYKEIRHKDNIKVKF